MFFFIFTNFTLTGVKIDHVVHFYTMTELSSRRLEFDRENILYELFTSTNDLSIIESKCQNQSNDLSWLMAFGRYLKTIRKNAHPINSNPILFEFTKNLLNEKHQITRELLLMLKQCVYLYPDKLNDLSFQRHLSIDLSTVSDLYIKYKYVRLLSLIMNEIDEQYLDKIFPSTEYLLQNYHQLDISIIIILEKLVLMRSDSKLQLSLNQIYNKTLYEYFNSNDFDDDEIIDLCYTLFQINRNKDLQCVFNISTIFIDLLKYIDNDTDTMINWLLTPETGDKFLIFILKLIKYLSSNREELKAQAGNDLYQNLVRTMKSFHDQLKNAYEKSLFPYNIKPLLNAFNLF